MPLIHSTKVNLFIPMIILLTLCLLILYGNASFGQRTKKGVLSPKVTHQLDGEEIKAFQVAYQDFLANKAIPIQKRDLKNYIIESTLEGSNFIFHFHPKSIAGAVKQLGGQSQDAVEVKYTIRRDNLAVVQRLFFR